MAPIDYSKWDNLDIPSQKAHLSNRHGSIQAVIVRCNVEKGSQPWSATTIPVDHPVFSQPVAPIPALIEVPLVLHRVGTQSAYRPDLDNQIATYLMIEPHDGFAPPAWQSHIGTVIVARKDRKPLLPQHLEGVWMYCDHILDYFSDIGGLPGDTGREPRYMYNRQAFEKWWKGYCKEQTQYRFGDGREEDINDWRAVRSPYEV